MPTGAGGLEDLATSFFRVTSMGPFFKHTHALRLSLSLSSLSFNLFLSRPYFFSISLSFYGSHGPLAYPYSPFSRGTLRRNSCSGSLCACAESATRAQCYRDGVSEGLRVAVRRGRHAHFAFLFRGSLASLPDLGRLARRRQEGVVGGAIAYFFSKGCGGKRVGTTSTTAEREQAEWPSQHIPVFLSKSRDPPSK